MTDATGLSIGATALTAVVVDRAAVRRSPVLTLFPHRPPEVGVPSENPRLDERGLVITDFVDRVGDPVGILAADGTSHRGATLVADALRALLYALPRGHEPGAPIAVTHPAHWHAGSVDALRAALAEITEFGPATPVLPDAAAVLTALQAEPGLPTRGLIALCDFGGSGTSITVVDAADGYRPVAPTVRHLDLSGDLIDQALLTHVLAGVPDSADLSGTSAIGSLTRLRGQCRAAKERLSTDTVTALSAELPGSAGEVRVTRTELDDVVRGPLAEFVDVLRHTIERTGARPADLAAVATAGGGARIPIVTTALSENFRVPVVTTPRPELSAAIGAGLTAVRGPDDDHTALAAAAPLTAAAPAAFDNAESGTFGALAWSDADDIPDVAPAAYEADQAADPQDLRPRLMFGAPESAADDRPAAVPWYRRTPVALAIGAAAVLAALAAAVFLVNRDDGDAPATTDTTTPVTTTTEGPAPAAPPPVDNPEPQAPAPETVTQQAPPPAATEAPPPPPAEAPPPPPPAEEPPPPPPAEEPPPPPPTTQPPPVIPTLPYTTIPGLPFVPAPPGFGG